MGTGWKKAKNLLALHACSRSPKADIDFDMQQLSEAGASRAEPILTPSVTSMTPSRTPSRFQLIRTSIRLSRSTCAICLEPMKPGTGHALFTAECSHTFHFSCIASNVKHGNLVCPVCRAKWREVPWEAPVELQNVQKLSGMRTRRSSSMGPRQSVQHGTTHSGIAEAEEDMRRLDPVLRILDESIANARGLRLISPPEPSVFDDDEPLQSTNGTSQEVSCTEVGSQVDDTREVPSINMANLEAVCFQAEGVTGLGVIDGNMRDSPSIELGLPTTEIETSLKELVLNARSEEGLLTTEIKPLEEEKESDSSCQHLPINARLELRCHAETASLAWSKSCESFTVLVHLKAAAISRTQNMQLSEAPNMSSSIGKGSGFSIDQGKEHATDTTSGVYSPLPYPSLSSRAPLDLVTVLDVSGSMAGTKLLLLKHAMAFVIQNLSSGDRLSVVAFSSTAKRLFPLRRMGPEGRQLALRAIDGLVATGGTNIAEGLRKGAKVLKDRREHNPVASIMLLSDGQDTYNFGAGQFSLLHGHGINYRCLVPRSLTYDLQNGQVQIPVHAFGFGADHDAATMHSISELSGGTFSFIQADGAVQDAFAQCIGGLLSVVVQDVQLSISTHMQNIELKNIQAGSYESSISDHGRSGIIKLGYLYAEEERDILCELNLPALEKPLKDNEFQMQILKVKCTYKDPVSQEICQTNPVELSISRTNHVPQIQPNGSLEVDRQRNRLHVAQAIVEAKSLADAGDIEGAQKLLHNSKLVLQKSEAFRAGDRLSKVLETEIIEIQVRMANRQMYERLGRAYILSAQSSHCRQRATTRGESVDGHSRDYQTPSMIDMVLRSQTISIPSSSRNRPISGEVCSGGSTLSSPERFWLRQSSLPVRQSRSNGI